MLAIMGDVRMESGGAGLYANETAISGETSSGGTWSAAKYKAFNDTTRSLFATNGVERLRVEGSTAYQWGIAAPGTAPTLSATTGAGNKLTGTYNAKYTYLRKSGDTILCESNPSPAGTAVDLNQEQLAITVTAPSDSQVTHIRVYRTLADGELYYYDSEVASSVTSGTLVRPDSQLSLLVEEDHDRPPTGGTCVTGPLYNGMLFMAVGSNIWWSDPQQPEYWPTTNFVECAGPDEPITAMCAFDGRLYAWSEYGCWHVQGAGSSVLLPIRLPVMTGAPHSHAVLPVVGRGIYHIGPDGIYLLAGGVDRKISDERFLPIFDGTTTNGVPAVTTTTGTWLATYHNRVYFHWGTGSILAWDQSTGRASYYQYDLALTPPVVDVANDKFYAFDSAGTIRRLEDPDVTTDIGTAIDWETQSKDYTLQTRAHFPRWAKYDVQTGAGCSSAKSEILLDGEVHQTHQIIQSSTAVASHNRNPRKRLIEIGNGELCSIRLSGTGPVTIYAAEME